MFGHKQISLRESGGEVVAEELATKMAKKGHRVICYNKGGCHASGAEFDTQDRSECKDVKIKTVPTIKKKCLAAGGCKRRFLRGNLKRVWKIFMWYIFMPRALHLFAGFRT